MTYFKEEGAELFQVSRLIYLFTQDIDKCVA